MLLNWSEMFQRCLIENARTVEGILPEKGEEECTERFLELEDWSRVYWFTSGNWYVRCSQIRGAARCTFG